MVADSFEPGARPVWIASYPRSGNTFLRIILQKVFHLASYSVYRVEGQDHRDPSADVLEQAPFLPRDWRTLLSQGLPTRSIPIKTHDAPQDDAPAIYIVRDGRAVVQSYYEYHQRYAFELPSLTEVIAGACQFGSWSEHYLSWQPQTRPRTLFLRYEELVADPKSAISSMADLLNIQPTQTDLPSFAELRARSPDFFRRGANSDFLNLWKPEHMALFNQLHGAVMQQLGYPLAESTDSGNGVGVELAHSAARLHRVYVEQLTKLGQAAASQEQLTQEVARLSQQLGQASARVADQEKLLNKSWVRLGVAVGAMQRTSVTNGH